MFSKDEKVRLKQIETALKYNKKLTEKGRKTLESMRKELIDKGIKAGSSAKEKKKVNKYGIEKGDVFVNSWGYDATFHDFYEVVDVLGDTKVKVREIYKAQGETPGYSSLDWTVRPQKSRFVEGEPELVRSVKKYSTRDGKEGCMITAKYKHQSAVYTENPFDSDWHEDNYH